MSQVIPTRPLLAPWYRLVGDGDRLLLEHGQVVVVFEGAAVRTLLPVLLPLLDGSRAVDELVGRLGPAVRPAVEHALDLLASNGLLVDGAAADPDDGVAVSAVHAVAAAYALAPRQAAERLAEASVAVVGNAGAGAEVARHLQAAGVGEVRPLRWDRKTGVDLVLVAPAPDELDQIAGWNRRTLRTRTPWLLLRPWDGRFAGIGPLIVPQETCCHECVLLRRGANLEYGVDLGDIEAAPLAATADPAFDAVVAGAAAHLALRWVAGRDTTIPGILYTVESRPSLAVTEHPVLRVPRCPACSPAETLAPPLPWHEAEAA